jgi:long-subunit acyl-CoA synthetase (AMP-forming)
MTYRALCIWDMADLLWLLNSYIAPDRFCQNLKLVQVYGLSETGFLTGLQDHEHTENKLMSCGRPCLGIDVRVVDESGKEVPEGQKGELVARGANVMRGYWNNPLETTRAFRDGMFLTGDIGYRDTNGYFYILDRRT